MPLLQHHCNFRLSWHTLATGSDSNSWCQALGLRPDYPIYLCNRAAALTNLNRHEQAHLIQTWHETTPTIYIRQHGGQIDPKGQLSRAGQLGPRLSEGLALIPLLQALTDSERAISVDPGYWKVLARNMYIWVDVTCGYVGDALHTF